MSQYLTAPFIGRHDAIKQTYPSLWGTWGPTHVASRPYATSAPMMRYPAMRGAEPYPLNSLGADAPAAKKALGGLAGTAGLVAAVAIGAYLLWRK